MGKAANDICYPMVLRPLQEDEGGGWLAEIPDLPGCASDGETPEEAVRNVLEAQRAWLTVARERGRDIPEPTHISEDYSGKFTLRLPKSLHRQLSLRAQMEGVSLNQLVLHFISYGLGLSSGSSGAKPPLQQGGAAVSLDAWQEWWLHGPSMERLRRRPEGHVFVWTIAEGSSILRYTGFWKGR